MTLLRSLFSRQRQSRHPAAITRREEAERARRASENKAAIERQAALAKAMTLRPLSTPMRPRDEVVADIRRTREARNSPVPGGTETGRIGPALDAVSPEGTRGALLPLLSCTTATVPAKSSSAGKSLQ
jgi:hypothetical protein